MRTVMLCSLLLVAFFAAGCRGKHTAPVPIVAAPAPAQASATNTAPTLAPPATDALPSFGSKDTPFPELAEKPGGASLPTPNPASKPGMTTPPGAAPKPGATPDPSAKKIPIKVQPLTPEQAAVMTAKPEQLLGSWKLEYIMGKDGKKMPVTEEHWVMI